MTAIIRQLQIDLITGEPNNIISWFDSIWSNINVIETDVYHENGGEFIYYVIIDNKTTGIFYRDDNNERFWCNYKHYWAILESNFNLRYVEIQGITKVLVENALNNVVTNVSIAAPADQKIRCRQRVEIALELYLATPTWGIVGSQEQIDKSLNKGIAKPVRGNMALDVNIENVLNNIIK